MYPSEVRATSLGLGLFATANLEASTAVGRFEGPVVSYADVPEQEIRYVLWLEKDRWLIPATAARYLNHSCQPNCKIELAGEVVVAVRVREGEELTIAYNLLGPADYSRFEQQPEEFFWDDRWTFQCGCGAVTCQGMIAGYVFRRKEGDLFVRRPLASMPASWRGPSQNEGSRQQLRELIARPLLVAPCGRKGRGVFAGRPFRQGQRIERAPVIVIPAGEWGQIEHTVLYDYTFSFGANLEDAAIALGFGSLYNHSSRPNATYIKCFEDRAIDFVALRDIKAGEEITVFYRSLSEGLAPLWFEPID